MRRTAGKRKYKQREYERHKGWSTEFEEMMKNGSSGTTDIVGTTKKRKATNSTGQVIAVPSATAAASE